MLVAEFVLNGEWNEVYLRAYLSEEFISQVRLHPVPTETEPDIRVWRLSPNVVFSLRTTYEVTDMVDGLILNHSIWRSIWKTPTMQRVRIFLWLLNHDRLLTNEERGRRHLIEDTSCKICDGGPKTTIHVVRDCPFARATRAGLLEDEPDTTFFEPHIHRWSLHFLSGRSNIVDSTIFASTCWLLWKNRNDLFQSELKTHEQIQFITKQLRQQIHTAFEQESTIFVAGGGGTPRVAGH
ncbi:unnamed protein product [Linum trigynum]|uniref:Reverse transcriptase zinc-binding domain-containing protein n=1 Tax=Linum trigynum TaxID=586398 RepID=A0AAV2G322_9ROSI